MKKKLMNGVGMSNFLKVLKIMRISVFLLMVFALQTWASSSYSQQTHVTINLKNVKVLEVLNEIENSTSFYFLFNKDLVDIERIVSVSAENKKIDAILTDLFAGTNVKFFVSGRQVVLTTEKEEKQIIQGKDISGKVTDSSGLPLPGVTVVLKGTNQGTITDGDGNYNLSNIPGNATLIFSFVGLKTQELPVSGKSYINVVLQEEAIGIEEVVAIGYGSMKKADLTGAVSSVSGTDLAKNTVVDPLFALQGKAAGVVITPVSGQPGAGIQVQIRGVQSINASNSPIYVIDGIISESMGNVNLNDIESISVLKDASSTAIYGSRAANGVVVITTKRGNKSDPIVTFHTYQGVRTSSNLMPEMLNSTDYLHLLEESYANSGLEVPNTSELVNTYYKDENGRMIDTDWLDVIMRNGSLQYYDISVSGGSEKSNYFISANYMDEEGVVMGQGQDKLNFRFNSDHTINKFIKFGNTLNIYSHKNFGLPSLGYVNYPNAPNPYGMALRKTPLTRPYEEDGSYGYTRYEGIEYRFIPPHLVANEYRRSAQSSGLTGNIFLKITPLEGLTVTPRISVSRNFMNASSFRPTVNLVGVESINVNNVSKNTNNSLNWQADLMMEYERSFNKKHNLKALLVYSQEETTFEDLGAARNNVPLNSIDYLNAGDPSTASNSNGYYDWSFVSYLGRLNYDFNRKYLFQATIRRDGSSRFAEDNRWGIFPSLSVGWRISEENFFLSAKGLINDLKLRASMGSVGNSDVGNYPTYASLSPTTYVLNETVVPGYQFQRAVNTNLKWETTMKKDFGVDASLFDSKIILSANYFIANTTNLLFSKPLPPSAGKATGLLVNGGEVENKGVEIDLGMRGEKGDFSYSVNFNFTRQRNEVVDLLGQDLTTSGLKVGSPLFSYYGFKSNGIIKTETDLAAAPTRNNLALGDVWLLDLGGTEGVIDNADNTLIGNRYPDFTYGLVSNFSYKWLSLGIQLQGVQGVDLPYTTGNYFNGNPENNRSLALDRWHATENPDGNMPKIRTSDPAGNFSFSDFWLSDASYLRINNVSLLYDIPKPMLDKVLLKYAQLYCSVQNLYTFTKSSYRGVEVDITNVSEYYGNPSTKMPLPRTWTIGLKISF